MIKSKYKKILPVLILAMASLTTGCGTVDPYAQDPTLIFAPTVYNDLGEEIKTYYIDKIFDLSKYNNIYEEDIINIAGKPKNVNVYENGTCYEYKDMEFTVINGKVTEFRYWFSEPMIYQYINDAYRMFGLSYHEDMETEYINNGSIYVSKNNGNNIEHFEVGNIMEEENPTFGSVYIVFGNGLEEIES